MAKYPKPEKTEHKKRTTGGKDFKTTRQTMNSYDPDRLVPNILMCLPSFRKDAF